MRGFSKKMLISILTSVVVFVTMIATTFAWVGIFTYANTDKFSLNLKTVGIDSNYYLTISGTGEKNTFSDTVEAIEIKKQILNNKYENRYADSPNELIERVFSTNSIQTVSTFVDDNNEIEKNFYRLNVNNQYVVSYDTTNEYYKFDIYLSVGTKEGITSDTTGIKANVKLAQITEALEGTKSFYKLINDNQFIDMPSDPIVDVLKTVPRNKSFNIDSKNAFRFSLSLYDPINVNDEYGDETPIKTLIYQGGKQLTTYNSSIDVYDLGGILDADHNLASKELLNVRWAYANTPLYFDKLDEACQNRNDLELVQENASLWDRTQHENYLGCMDGIQTKMKISICMWFEGWDADCVKGIEEKPISLNLAFESNTID